MHAIEAASYFLQNDAYIEIISDHLSTGKIEHLRHLSRFESFNYYELTSSWGRAVIGLKEQYLDFDSYKSTYLYPLIEKMNLKDFLIRGRVEQICKKSLSKNADNIDKRIQDLFTVHSYHLPEVDDKQSSQLDPAILKSLETPLDRYGEYDFVVDCTGYSLEPGLGHDGSFVLGEKYLEKPELLLSGAKAWDYKEKNSENKIAIVFENELGLKEACSFAKQFEEQKIKELKIICTKKELHNHEDFEFLQSMQKSFAGKKQVEYQENLKKWQSLETYEQAKIPCPKYDTSALEIYTDYNLVAVHQLIDRAGIYLSLESKDSDCTLHLDQIINLRKMNKDISFSRWIFSPSNSKDSELKEPGFYQIDLNGEDLRLNALAIELAFKDMLRYFTKV